jgi:hypothetical protein
MMMFAKMSPILRGPFGNILIKFAMWLTGMNKVNRIYDTSKQYEGPEFCKHLLQDVGVNIVVENIEVLNQYEELRLSLSRTMHTVT